MITGLAPPSADVDPPAPADAPDASEPDDAEPARPGWLPAPRATAVAILSMLAFGVVAGSLVKPEAESLARTYVVAMPPAATTPAVTPAAESGSSSDGGGGGGGGGGGSSSGSGSGSGSGSTAPADSLDTGAATLPPDTGTGDQGTGDGGGGGGEASSACPRSSMCS